MNYFEMSQTIVNGVGGLFTVVGTAFKINAINILVSSSIFQQLGVTSDFPDNLFNIAGYQNCIFTGNLFSNNILYKNALSLGSQSGQVYLYNNTFDSALLIAPLVYLSAGSAVIDGCTITNIHDNYLVIDGLSAYMMSEFISKFLEISLNFPSG